MKILFNIVICIFFKRLKKGNSYELRHKYVKLITLAYIFWTTTVLQKQRRYAAKLSLCCYLWVIVITSKLFLSIIFCCVDERELKLQQWRGLIICCTGSKTRILQGQNLLPFCSLLESWPHCYILKLNAYTLRGGILVIFKITQNGFNIILLVSTEGSFF